MQLVKYKWDVKGLSGQPFLFARDGKETVKIKLFDEKISMKLGKRTCIGYNKNGTHFECPSKRSVDNERVCRECALNDDFFMCMKCTGEECINEPQRPSCMENKYFIYLAAFSSMLKVGISYEFRILERLIEQGADMGAKIGMVKDGKLAREVEQKISKELNISDRISGVDKQRMLFGSPNVASMNIFNAYNKLRTNGVSSHLINPEIYNLQSIYRVSSISNMPLSIDVKEGAAVEGDIVAAKGNIIIVKNSTGLFSINASKMVCCDVELN
ncbi:MAG TPA: DUF2797 domain-containing protein [archaeon]|nr:DUF2797 domain-containing protein [archaeon]